MKKRRRRVGRRRYQIRKKYGHVQGASCGKGGISIGEKRKRTNARFLFTLSWKGAREHSRHLSSPLTSTATLAYRSLPPTSYSPLPMSAAPHEPAQATHLANGALSDPVLARDIQPASLRVAVDALSNPETLANGHDPHEKHAAADDSALDQKDTNETPADMTLGAETDAIDTKGVEATPASVVVEVRPLSCLPFSPPAHPCHVSLEADQPRRRGRAGRESGGFHSRRAYWSYTRYVYA